ncbi:peptidylprolyl isomerase [Dyella thiooxydans]|uniref:Peptidyl-prolyl cis-trans isomerase n=1 Tax=Dyella thiooxydans TaxID=445710 RepID=A0A160MZM0_9GAMM|nr:FKBP-type peptidyl-prolyl cis-trans isomerase [Dyella thiooxydans]AND68780.1 peptidylprolyl isomerase [Dyella thiooxydans]
MRRLLCLLPLLLAACSSQHAAPAADIPAMQSIDTVVGTGPVAKPGDTVEVNYTGWLYDPKAPDHHGKKFDASQDHGGTFAFPLGAGQVIKGWDEGVAGMHVGGKRTLLIPSSMGYGSRGAGSAIPPNAALVFDVELVSIK